MSEGNAFQVCSQGLDTTENLAEIVECLAIRQAEVGWLWIASLYGFDGCPKTVEQDFRHN